MNLATVMEVFTRVGDPNTKKRLMILRQMVQKTGNHDNILLGSSLSLTYFILMTITKCSFDANKCGTYISHLNDVISQGTIMRFS